MKHFAARALGILLCSVGLHALGMDIRPLDFQPLTSLPWKDTPGASLEAHLARIYLEPDADIRYPVLATYLQQIPSSKLESAFDLCLRFECTQQPHNFVAFFMPIWGERNPQAAWKRVESLFQLQDTHWLNYDRWGNEKIAFRNLEAMRKSAFWIDPRWSENFLIGLNRSHLSASEKHSLREAFMSKWSPIYDSPPSEHPTGVYADQADGLLEALEIPAERIPAEIKSAFRDKQPTGIKMLLRRWLASKPDSALLIAMLAEKLDAEDDALSLLWMQVAPNTLIEWTDAQQNLKKPPLRIMGMLLSQLDDTMRQKWLQNAEEDGTSGRMFHDLICNWASWDPKPALQAAIGTNEPLTIRDAADHVVYAGFGARNALPNGLMAIREHNVGSLPKPLRETTLQEYGIQIMEYWGDTDIGGAARYGLDFMLKTDYAPRENLIKLFSGDDAFSSDSDMIDRTFCALRMWAVLQPEPMRAWIATQKDTDMRKALTWLLEHPWGTGQP